MFICYLTSQTTSIHTHRWVGWFRDAGHRVACVASPSCPPLEMEGVSFHTIPLTERGRTRFKAAWYRLLALSLARLLHTLKPDVLHVHWLDVMADVAAWSGFRPLLLTAWGSDIMGLPASVPLRRGLVKALRRADAVIGDCTGICDEMVRLGARRDRTHLIFWGVDCERFCPGPPDSGLLDRLGLGGKKVVLSLRKFRSFYNQATILRSAPAVCRRFPEAVFLHVDCPVENGPVWAEYLEHRGLARDLGVEPSCRWIEGGVSYGEMPDVMRLADVAVSVPVRDATAVSLLEAMATGTPVIASDIPANREWVVPAENGLLVPPRDADALAGWVARVLSDRGAGEVMGRQAREVVLARADQRANMEAVERIYRNVAGMK